MPSEQSDIYAVVRGDIASDEYVRRLRNRARNRELSTREQIRAARLALRRIARMAYWESVPPDELRLVLTDIEELHRATGDALIRGRGSRS